MLISYMPPTSDYIPLISEFGSLVGNVVVYSVISLKEEDVGSIPDVVSDRPNIMSDSICSCFGISGNIT